MRLIQKIELQWCTAHKGVPGNEKTDEWAKLPADKPDPHGVEYLGCGGRYGRRCPPPRSLTHLKRSITDANWVEAMAWANAKATHKERQRLDFISANTNKRLVSSFYRLKWVTVSLASTSSRRRADLLPRVVVPIQDPGTGASLQELPSLEVPAEDPVGRGAKGHRKGE